MRDQKQTSRVRREAKELRAALTESVPLAPYRGVIFNGKTGRWLMRVRDLHLGSAATMEDAVALLTQHVGPDRLPSFKRNRLDGKFLQNRMEPRAERFRSLHSIFGCCLPGDLEAAQIAYDGVRTSSHLDMPDRSHRDMFEQDPLMEILSIQGKTGPWKRALYEAWLANPTSRRLDVLTCQPLLGDMEAQELAEQQISILRTAAQALSGKTFPAWSDSTGRNNQFHSGWLALLQSLAVVKLDPLGLLALGEGLKPHSFCPIDWAFSKLSAMNDGALVLRRAWLCDLTSAPGWCRAIELARKECAEVASRHRVHAVPRLDHSHAGYLFPWTFRVGALTRTAHLRPSAAAAPPAPSICPTCHQCVRKPELPQKRQGLSLWEGVSLRQFRVMFPDQNEWVERLSNCKSHGTRNLATLMQALDQQHHPWELTTMWLCLLNDADLDLSVNFWDDHAPQLQEKALAHRRIHGFWPHPAVASASLLAELAGAPRAATSKRPAEAESIWSIMPPPLPASALRRRLTGKRPRMNPEVLADPTATAAIPADAPSAEEEQQSPAEVQSPEVVPVLPCRRRSASPATSAAGGSLELLRSMESPQGLQKVARARSASCQKTRRKQRVAAPPRPKSWQ